MGYKVIFVFALSVGAFFIWVVPKVLERLTSDYSGIDVRINAIKHFSNLDTYVYGMSLVDEKNQAPDVGLILSMVLHGGIMEVVVFFIVLLSIFFRLSHAARLFLILVLFSKVKVTYPFLWVVFAALFIIGKKGGAAREGKSDC